MQKEVLLLFSLMHSVAEHAVPEDIFYHAALQGAASDTHSNIHSQNPCLLINLLKCMFLNLSQHTMLHNVLLSFKYVCILPLHRCFVSCDVLTVRS